ncbi:MAG: asparagine--tRNA ligase [Peptococcaceae bacterium]|jgi:asparaginyl-tRNA synthetase|nr:asparagine--tRNA ligase [Peptococcaceae bacterium]MDH7523854.1 asparagine--tRNA ligase [Peptococcaceae bacterium]
MKSVSVKELYLKPEDYLGKRILVNGWVRTARSSKTFGFIELNDGSCFKNLQVVYSDGLSNYQEVAKLNIGSALRVDGELVESPGAGQPFELKALNIVIEGLSSPEYPLQKKRHSFEFLRSIAHLRPRTSTFSAVFRLRSVLAYAIHKFFQERGFVYVHTPIITGSDAEGAGEMFRVSTLDLDHIPRDEQGRPDFSQDFFGKETNLTVSGQLEVETFCLAYGKVYTFGPTFRAENSNTARHAAEFWMIEPEIAFAGLQENMELAEEMMKYVIGYALENAPEELNFFQKFVDNNLLGRLENICNSDFARISYTEAVGMLQKAEVEFLYPPQWGSDLQTEHERYLTERVFQKPLFVTDYPKEIKAFYMRLNDDSRTVAAMDLLVPGVGEIIGGSQREERLEILEKRMEEKGLKKADYWWYLDIRKYGGVKHAGFGLGFERLLMYLTGMTNIRDVIPFPRTVKNAQF